MIGTAFFLDFIDWLTFPLTLTLSLIIFRYEDFFGTKKNKGPKEKAKSRDRFEGDSGSDDEQDFDKVLENQALYSLDVLQIYNGTLHTLLLL